MASEIDEIRLSCEDEIERKRNGLRKRKEKKKGQEVGS